MPSSSAAGCTARFRFQQVAVDGLTSLMLAVCLAARDGEIAVRGRPKAPEGRRAIYDHPDKGPAGLDVVPRRWCAFEWDGVPADGDPLREPEIGVRAALRRLPPAFRAASCGWQISASAGFKPGFRLRTWHWLDHPTTGAELKVWCRPAIERALLDPVTLVEAQPHYLAVTVAGGPDPCPQRFGILRQAREAVTVPDIAGMIRAMAERERAERLARHGPVPDRRFNPAAARSYAERRIADCIEAVRSAPDGTKHPTYCTEAARAKALCDRFGVDWRPVRRELRDTYEATLPPREAARRRQSSTDGVLRWLEGRGA